MIKTSCRKAFTDTLTLLAKENKDIFAVTTDASGSVTLGGFSKEFPMQFADMGIAEQNSVAVSAGLSLTGFNVFVCGPACFMTARAYEQIKVDVGYNHTNVKLIGVSGGLSYGPLGGTHTTLHDLAGLRALPNIVTLLPADGEQTRVLTEYLATYNGPAYMRMGRGDVPAVYESGEIFEVGKAKKLREGTDLTIIAAGETVWHAVQAADKLALKGIKARVLDFFSIRPCDSEAVLAAASETGRILVVEEHSVNGGLGSLVSELVVQNCPVPVKLLGLPDAEIIVGESSQLFAHYGIDADGIIMAATELLKK